MGRAIGGKLFRRGKHASGKILRGLPLRFEAFFPGSSQQIVSGVDSRISDGILVKRLT
jgi:hypothetical protein